MVYKTALIKQPKVDDDQVRYPDGNTKDIINTVKWADAKAAWYTTTFAPTLRGKTLFETCRNIWQFVKTQIPYVLDPGGEQYIKSPGRLWSDKAGDCKSFSLFTASCLRNLGIPYGYRFASYSKTDPTPTHVYVYVPLDDGEIILDSVWNGKFNTQKEYTFKQDHLMSRIAYLGGVGKANAVTAAKRAAVLQSRKPKHVPGVISLPKDLNEVSEDEFDLLLTRQRLEIERQNSASVGGPFNWQIEKYDRALATVNSALGALKRGDAEHLQRMSEHFHANGQPMIGGFFGKLWKGVKNIHKSVTKAIVKVASFPMRLIAKGILEIYLPKAAGTFLYLFAAENALPDKMKKKRKKSEGFKNFVIKKIGMKEKHFMGIIRNSLTKKLKMSPESYLANILKSTAVKGIGAIGYHTRRNQVNLQWNKKRRKKFKHVNAYLHGLESHPDSIRENAIIAGLSGELGLGSIGLSLPKMDVNAMMETADNIQQAVNTGKASGGGKALNIANGVLTAAGSVAKYIPVIGQVAGPIIKALQWIISKLGGKKEGVDMGAEDIPDPVADAGNAYNYGDLKEDYSNLSPKSKQYTKEVASDMIDEGYSYDQAEQKLRTKAPYLNDNQRKEIASEVEEGYEPVTEQQGTEYASAIRQGRTDPTGNDIDMLERTGGGSGTGICKC